MTRLERPLVSRTLQTTGDVVVHAELDLAIRSNLETWVEARFLVDSGTEMTTLWTTTAQE
jgi:hypothetical protein